MSNGGIIQPALRGAYNHEFGDAQSNITSNFAVAQNLPFVTEGAKRERNWLSLNPYVTAALPNNWMFQAEYEHDFLRSNVSENIFNLAASYKW